MYERSAIVLERYYSNILKFDEKPNLKNIYKNFKELVEELQKYQLILEEEEVVINEFDKIANEIRKLAIKAFKAVDGKGLSRVDFFVEKDTNEIIINEINTLPGFTNISMYPKLFEASGIAYSDLLDKVIKLALEE